MIVISTSYFIIFGGNDVSPCFCIDEAIFATGFYKCSWTEIAGKEFYLVVTGLTQQFAGDTADDKFLTAFYDDEQSILAITVPF
jgi:hypothetical protein